LAGENRIAGSFPHYLEMAGFVLVALRAQGGSFPAPQTEEIKWSSCPLLVCINQDQLYCMDVHVSISGLVPVRTELHVS